MKRRPGIQDGSRRVWEVVRDGKEGRGDAGVGGRGVGVAWEKAARARAPRPHVDRILLSLYLNNGTANFYECWIIGILLMRGF